MNTKEVKLMIIENFIDWFTTGDDERVLMKQAAQEYVAEDHVDEIKQSLTQWFKIMREDGTIQYATREGEYFYIYGSGFAIKTLRAVKIEPCDGLPSTLVEGVAYFDDEIEYRAYANPHHKWNGWACPFIHQDDVERLCKDLSNEGNTYTMTENGVMWSDGFDEQHENTIKEIDGVKYYDFGSFGLTFYFAET